MHRVLTNAEAYWLNLVLADLAECCDTASTNHNLRFLGKGLYARVYAAASLADLVVKVSNDESDGYRAYADWIYENKMWEKSPHFPRIYMVFKFGKHACYVLERLNEGDKNMGSPHNKTVDRGRDVMLGHSKPKNSFEKACTMIHKNFNRCYYDLHAGNVMTRNDGTSVITDPMG